MVHYILTQQLMLLNTTMVQWSPVEAVDTSNLATNGLRLQWRLHYDKKWHKTLEDTQAMM